MREILPTILDWHAQGKDVALATVVKAWGSAPRPLGAKMAISESGEMVGSVSSGCVEGAVVEASREVLGTGAARLLSYGVTDETAWSVGLSCGGTIEVFLERLKIDDATFTALRRAIEDERLLLAATVVCGPTTGSRLLIDPNGEERPLGGLGDPALDREALTAAKSVAASLTVSRNELGDGRTERADVFFDLFAPPPQLVIVGAVHVAVHLVRLAKQLGYRTLVVDPRSAFATPERFAEADRLIPDWPQNALPKIDLNETACVAVLSHDLKIDLPALEAALRSRCLYIGALGSKKTHRKRIEALERAGFSEHELARVRSPIGLDLGGRRAEEIALAIMAEVVAARNGRLGSASKDTDGRASS